MNAEREGPDPRGPAEPRTPTESRGPEEPGAPGRPRGPGEPPGGAPAPGEPDSNGGGIATRAEESARRRLPEREPGAIESRRGERSIGELIRDLRDEGQRLLRQEMALARTEMAEKAETYRKNAVWLGIGAGLLLVALFPLVDALVQGVEILLAEAGMSAEVLTWLAPLAVGVVLAGIGYALFRKGSQAMSREGVVPSKTVESLDEDRRWAQARGRDVKRSIRDG